MRFSLSKGTRVTRFCRVGAAALAIAAACGSAAFLIGHFPSANAASQPRMQRDGSVELGGRTVRCDNVRTRLDNGLPNLGMASPDDRTLMLNPVLLRSETETVQLFVFYHECGHHQVGASELNADCWAVGQGVRGGWLDRRGLGEVCRSFEDAPESSSHPSGRRRCKNLDRCFAEATTALARTQLQVLPQTPITQPARNQRPPGRLIEASAGDTSPSILQSGPFLLRNGTGR